MRRAIQGACDFGADLSSCLHAMAGLHPQTLTLNPNPPCRAAQKGLGWRVGLGLGVATWLPEGRAASLATREGCWGRRPGGF